MPNAATPNAHSPADLIARSWQFWETTANRALTLGDHMRETGFRYLESLAAQPPEADLPDWGDLVKDAWEYAMDVPGRAVLFADILRKRGNHFLDIVQNGQPPVLTFDYRIIMDGRGLERPVNHDLAMILPQNGETLDMEKRPVVVIDPRAGHGPGIGGSKQDSEIGMALRQGHPVYFILFYPDPEPGQTYADVKAAQTRFVEAVRERHPKAPEPPVIGNCQAGWAVALLSADRPDVTGPLVLNGSPLSYWAGVDGKNPMRYRGGLLGGIWLTSLLCDLGNGKFDGANLVMNFENLNPANTLWTKQYNVWANVDGEETRYLNFEKWWNSYFMMNSEEIHFIVKDLFMGNRLERGIVELDEGRKIDLKNLRDPVMVFASSGDNITPPQQALNWIAKVYGTVDEIKRCRQVIIYRVHPTVGHLGIFVSGKVARKEHKEIIENIDNMDYLPPGLYELVIREEKKTLAENGEEIVLTDYIAKFQEREMADILATDDGFEDEEDFVTVGLVSEANDRMYRLFFAPWVKLSVNELLAEDLKWLHPMRASRYGFSDWNPLMAPIRLMAPAVRENWKPASPANRFRQAEKRVSDAIVGGLNAWRDMRDAADEFLFKTVYGNPAWSLVFPEANRSETEADGAAAEIAARAEAATAADRDEWMDKINKGGIPAGIVRAIVWMAGADREFDEREFSEAGRIVRESERFADMSLDAFKEMAKEQARILQVDPEKARNALRRLLPRAEHRREAFEIAEKIAMADLVLVEEEKKALKTLREILQLEPAAA
ncbi:MAG: DUF3141 domain-containing protein [Desulfococcaceae bacterium]